MHLKNLPPDLEILKVWDGVSFSKVEFINLSKLREYSHGKAAPFGSSLLPLLPPSVSILRCHSISSLTVPHLWNVRILELREIDSPLRFEQLPFLEVLRFFQVYFGNHNFLLRDLPSFRSLIFGQQSITFQDGIRELILTQKNKAK